jgi:hypothetical protein
MNGLVSLEPRELDAFVRTWERWFDEGDYERLAAFYAEDARLIATVDGAWRIIEDISSVGPSAPAG